MNSKDLSYQLLDDYRKRWLNKNLGFTDNSIGESQAG